MSNNETSIIISAVDKTGDALRSVKTGLGQVGEQASSLQGALAGFAAAAGVMTFAGMIKGAIDGAAGMHDLAQKTGASVEALSALKDVAALSDTSLEDVGNGMSKMAKAMPDMSDKSKGISKALAAIGLEGDKIAKMNTDDAFKAIAEGMAGVNDSAGKTAASMEIFGKTGKELIPFLNDLGAAGKIQATITKEQAAQADEFGDNLMKLSISGQAWKRELAMGMVPALSEFSGAMVDVLNGSGGLRDEMHKLSADGSINQWATSTINAMTYTADAVDGFIRVFKQFSTSIVTTVYDIEMANKLAGSWLSGKVLLPSGRAEMAQILAERRAFSTAANEATAINLETPLIGQRLRTAFQAAQDAARENPQTSKRKGDVDPASLSTDKPQSNSYANEYKNLKEALEKYIPQLEAERIGTSQLSESQKIALEIKRNLTKADQDALAPLLEKAKAGEHALQMQKFISEAEKEAYLEEQKRAESLQKNAVAIADDAKNIREHTQEIGLSQGAIDALKASRDIDTIALKEHELAELDAAGVCTAYSAALRENVEALKDRQSALSKQSYKQIGSDAAKKAADDWAKASEKIGDSISDALMRGFESGKGFAQTLRDTVENMFKTMILKPIIQATVTGTMSSVGWGAASAATGTTSGSSTSSLGGASNLYSMGSNAYSLYNSGASSMYGNFATSSVGQGLGLSTAQAAGYQAPVYAANGVLVSEGTGTAAGGLTSTGAAGASAASYIPVIGWIIATLLTANSGFNRVFGFGNKTYGDTGIEGSFTGSGFAGYRYADWKQKGGWLRKDKSGTEYGALADDTTTGLSAIVTATKMSFDNLFAIMGDAPRNLDAWSYAIKGSFSTQAEMTTMIKALADSMAAQLVPEFIALQDEGEALSDTVIRMQKEFVATNRIIDILGMTSTAFGSVGISSAAARDRLVDAAGTLDALSTSVSTYYSTYYSAAEQQAQATKDLTSSFDALGLAMPSSKDAFKDLVKGLDLSTDAGTSAFVGLMAISTAFATVTDAIAAAATAAAAAIATANSSKASILDSLGTDAEKLAAAQGKVSAAFVGLGLSIPATADDFIAIANGADATAAAGQSLIAALAAVAPAFATVTAAASAASAAASESKLSIVDSLSSDTEKLLAAQAKVIYGFASLNLSVPETADAFIALANGTNTTTAAGQSLLSTLAEIAPSFAAVEASFLSLYDTLTNALSSISTTDNAASLAGRYSAQSSLDSAISASQSGSSLLSYTDAIASAITELSKPAESLYASFEEYARAQGRAVASITILQSIAYSNSHAGGLERVPYDGYRATLHAGEAIVDAQSTAAISRYFGGGSGNSMAQLESLVSALTQEVINLRAEARATASNTNRMAKSIDRAMPDGDAISTRAAA